MPNTEKNVETQFSFRPKCGSAGRAFCQDTDIVQPQGRIRRVSKMMALAIHLQGLVDAGDVKDYATMARAGHVSRARITQIMDLTLLAPDIQEDLLFLPKISQGRDKLNERQLRSIAAEIYWDQQRLRWRDLLTSLGIDIPE